MEYQLGLDLPNQYNNTTLMHLGVSSNFIIKGPFDASIISDHISGLGNNKNYNESCHCCGGCRSSDKKSDSKKQRMAVFESMQCVQINEDSDCDTEDEEDDEEEVHDCEHHDHHDGEVNHCHDQCELMSSSDCLEVLDLEKSTEHCQQEERSKNQSGRFNKVEKYLSQQAKKRKQISDIADSVDFKSDEDKSVEIKNESGKLDAQFEKEMSELKKKISVMSQSSEKTK